MRQDPNIAQVELVANLLGPLRDELVFVGGCAVGLLITDKAAAPVRVTYDVDLVVHVTTRSDFGRIEKQFESLGFRHDVSQDAPICRWTYGKVKVDLMPTDESILDFSNRWYPLATDTAQVVVLPSGQRIRLVSAPAFIATKFEAYHNRGQGDLLASHDIEDIINVVDGRAELLSEIEQAPAELRSYLTDRCNQLLRAKDFEYFLPAIMNDGDSPPLRSDDVLQKLRAIAS